MRSVSSSLALRRWAGRRGAAVVGVQASGGQALEERPGARDGLSHAGGAMPLPSRPGMPAGECSVQLSWRGDQLPYPSGHMTAGGRPVGTRTGGSGRVVTALDSVSVRRFTTDQVILDSIDWSVRAGEHWALLGANGAG